MSTVKEKIYQSTLEMISERGFHDAPISKIAKHAKISPASIYNHFENKDDLIAKLYIDLKEQLALAIMKGIDLSLDPRTIIYKAWKNTYDFYTQNINEKNFLKYYENTPLVDKIEGNKFYEILAPFVGFLEEMKEKKVIRNLPMIITAIMIFEFAGNLADASAKKVVEMTDSLLEETFQAVWNGIKSPFYNN